MYLMYFSCPVLEDGTIDYDHAMPHPELNPEILEMDWLDWEGTGKMIDGGMYTNGEEVRFVMIREEAAAAMKPAA